MQSILHGEDCIIPDAVFVQQIPEENDSDRDEFNIDTNSWFFGQVYYCFKNMVMQGSSAICGVTKMGKIIETEKNKCNTFLCNNWRRWWSGSWLFISSDISCKLVFAPWF